jgi:hypothetical protein
MQALIIVILLTSLANLMSLPAIAGDVYGQDISPDVEKQLEQAKIFGFLIWRLTITRKLLMYSGRYETRIQTTIGRSLTWG